MEDRGCYRGGCFFEHDSIHLQSVTATWMKCEHCGYIGVIMPNQTMTTSCFAMWCTHKYERIAFDPEVNSENVIFKALGSQEASIFYRIPSR